MKKITSLHRGYVSNKITETAPINYNGKYGKGYTTMSHNPNSTQYCFINYYVA
jgi:hypothetical protein